MSNGSSGPHGVELKYDNLKLKAWEDKTKPAIIEVTLPSGEIVTTKINLQTGKVIT